MDGDRPVTGQWNYDADNRERRPRRETLGVADPWWPEEDEIDEQVRTDLDRWRPMGSSSSGEDGPRRFAATREEALAALATSSSTGCRPSAATRTRC